MRKLLTNRIIILLVVLLSVGYFAYDSYFRIPEKISQPGLEQGVPNSDQIGSFNVLLLGLDGRSGLGDRADTIIIASVDSKANKASLLSVPRDTRVKIKGSWDKINAAYAYGGVALTREAIQELLGVRIDRYTVVDFAGLVSLVDTVGGLEVDVPVRMYVPLEGIDLQPGKQHLTGEQVLAFARFRGTPEGDIDRVKRQQEVIQLLLAKALQADKLPLLGQYIGIAQKNVKTDLTVQELVALARIYDEVAKNGISSAVLPGENKKIDGIWYWEPDLSKLGGIYGTEFRQ